VPSKKGGLPPNMVEHNLSHVLYTEVVKPSINGDHGSNTT
jgi:hypothetical protein